MAPALARAEDALARFDERLRTSPIRDGFIARNHFIDACASLWLDGELVHLEDLVLHDARMDIRAPSHELTRAHAVLRRRRQIEAAPADWAVSRAGIKVLRGDEIASDDIHSEPEIALRDDLAVAADWDKQLAAIDDVVDRSKRLLAGLPLPERKRNEFIYDPDVDEQARYSDWHTIVAQSASDAPAFAAILALDAFEAIKPIPTQPWLGRLLAAALLRARGKTTMMIALNDGLKAIPRERRRARDAATRFSAYLQALTLAAEQGLKTHDRLINARALLMRRLEGRRATSHLSQALDLALSRPIVSAPLLAAHCNVSTRAALNLVLELQLREATGRGRYRAWAIL